MVSDQQRGNVMVAMGELMAVESPVDVANISDMATMDEPQTREVLEDLVAAGAIVVQSQEMGTYDFAPTPAIDAAAGTPQLPEGEPESDPLDVGPVALPLPTGDLHNTVMYDTSHEARITAEMAEVLDAETLGSMVMAGISGARAAGASGFLLRVKL